MERAVGMVDEARQGEDMLTAIDPSTALAIAMAELELLRAEVALTQVQVASYAPITLPEPVIHDDLSPLGRRYR